jgi:branched-subunit amino acid aminotransferase/4-amino-4-deoxychorismate lyase
MILLNHEGNACEAIGCSFAFIKNDFLYFPTPESGGYQSKFIKQVVSSAELCGLKASPKDEISTDDLLDADEIFLIDNCLGIQKVLGIGNRRYYSRKTIAIAQKFSEMAKTDRTSKN